MKKGIGTPESRELAFRVFRLFGGRNIPRSLERLGGLAMTATVPSSGNSGTKARLYICRAISLSF